MILIIMKYPTDIHMSGIFENDKDKYNASKENGVKIIYFTFSKNEYEYFAPVYNDLGDLYTLIEKRIKDFGFKLKDFK